MYGLAKNKYVHRIMYERSIDKRHLPTLLGDIPDGSYILAFWRNEWMEEYAPWSGESTLCSIEKNCTSFAKAQFWFFRST